MTYYDLLQHYLYSFQRYLYELGLRIFYGIFGFILTLLLFQWYQSTLLFCLLPDDDTVLFTYNSAEELAFYKLYFSLALFIYLPIWLAQIFLFARPGLYKYQSDFLGSILKWGIATYLFLLGVGLFLGVPLMWEFEIDDLEFFEGLPILAEITLLDYIDIIIEIGFLVILLVPFVSVGLYKLWIFLMGNKAHFFSRRIFYLCAVLCTSGWLFVELVVCYELFAFHTNVKDMLIRKGK